MYLLNSFATDRPGPNPIRTTMVSIQGGGKDEWVPIAHGSPKVPMQAVLRPVSVGVYLHNSNEMKATDREEQAIPAHDRALVAFRVRLLTPIPAK